MDVLLLELIAWNFQEKTDLKTCWIIYWSNRANVIFQDVFIEPLLKCKTSEIWTSILGLKKGRMLFLIIIIIPRVVLLTPIIQSFTHQFVGMQTRCIFPHFLYHRATFSLWLIYGLHFENRSGTESWSSERLQKNDHFLPQWCINLKLFFTAHSSWPERTRITGLR